MAGISSPADDYLDRDLDLHDLLIQHPAATYEGLQEHLPENVRLGEVSD